PSRGIPGGDRRRRHHLALDAGGERPRVPPRASCQAARAGPPHRASRDAHRPQRDRDLSTARGTGPVPPLPSGEAEASGRVLDADELLARLLDWVVSSGATRCVLGAVDELERAVPVAPRLTALLTALSVKLRSEGVTMLALKKIGELTSAGIDFADTAISTIV